MLRHLALTIFFISFTSVFADEPAKAPPGVREIELKTEKVGEVVHWMPEKIEVKPGEKITIVAKHELEGGFDFHGLFVPELKISEKVERNKPTKVERTIPKSMKPGEYKVLCQFHPKHAPAFLVVKK